MTLHGPTRISCCEARSPRGGEGDAPEVPQEAPGLHARDDEVGAVELQRCWLSSTGEASGAWQRTYPEKAVHVGRPVRLAKSVAEHRVAAYLGVVCVVARS